MQERIACLDNLVSLNRRPRAILFASGVSEAAQTPNRGMHGCRPRAARFYLGARAILTAGGTAGGLIQLYSLMTPLPGSGFVDLSQGGSAASRYHEHKAEEADYVDLVAIANFDLRRSIRRGCRASDHALAEIRPGESAGETRSRRRSLKKARPLKPEP